MYRRFKRSQQNPTCTFTNRAVLTNSVQQTIRTIYLRPLSLNPYLRCRDRWPNFYSCIDSGARIICSLQQWRPDSLLAESRDCRQGDYKSCWLVYRRRCTSRTSSQKSQHEERKNFPGLMSSRRKTSNPDRFAFLELGQPLRLIPCFLP